MVSLVLWHHNSHIPFTSDIQYVVPMDSALCYSQCQSKKLIVSELKMAAGFSVSLLQEKPTPSCVPYPVALELTRCSLTLEMQSAYVDMCSSVEKKKTPHDNDMASSIFIYFHIVRF